MNYKLSVVLPCFNVEEYIENILKCLLNQKYENIEIIAIDDCSDDDTYNKLKKFKKNENIKIFRNKENKGLAYTRNLGVKKATGEVVGFIDPDDKIDEDYYEILMKKMSESNSDIVVTDILSIEEGNENNRYLAKGCYGEVNKFNLINNGMSASACNKIFKKELLIKYPFLEGKINEDVASIIPVIMKSNRIDYTNKTKYYYYQRRNSIQNSNISEKRFDMFDAVKICLKRIEKEQKFEEIKEAILYHQLFMLYAYVLPKEGKFWKRYRYIKVFMKKQKKYDLCNNKHISKYLNDMSIEERKYFSKLVKCLKYRMAFKANCIIHFKDLKMNLKNYIKDIIRIITKRTVIKRTISMKDLIRLAKKQSKKKDGKIKISVVVPNYNYEKFLMPRLYSILNQTEKIYEIILLDDKSLDGSRALINEFIYNVKDYINVNKIYNTENTGCAFKQWEKGFKLAKGDYVWIAEADDCCSKYLLRNLLKPIYKNKNIYISYADTAFINAWDKIFLKTIKPEIDLRKTGHWNKNFVNLGKDEINTYCFLNCTIANVSSCIIKNENYDEIFERIIEYRQAGDWLFYVSVINKGYISYIDKPLNYYRVHGNNITSTMKKQKHLDEIKRIHKEMYSLTEITDWHEEEFRKRYEFLEEVWQLKKSK